MKGTFCVLVVMAKKKLVVIIILYPSGLELITSAAATLPPAPGLETTVMGCPRYFGARLATRRERRSLVAPGVYGMTISIGFVGYTSLPAACPLAVTTSTPRRTAIVTLFIRRPPFLIPWLGGLPLIFFVTQPAYTIPDTGVKLVPQLNRRS